MKTVTMVRSPKSFDNRVQLLIKTNNKRMVECEVEKNDVLSMLNKGWTTTGKTTTIGFSTAKRIRIVMQKEEYEIKTMMFKNDVKAKNYAKFNGMKII